MPTARPRSRSRRTAAPVAATEKENSENSIMEMEGEVEDTAGNGSGTKRSRSARTSVESRTDDTQGGLDGLLSMAAGGAAAANEGEDYEEEKKDGDADADAAQDPEEQEEEQEKDDDDEEDQEEAARTRKKSRRVRGGAKKSSSRHRTAADLLDDDSDDDDDDDDEGEYERSDAPPGSPPRSSSTARRQERQVITSPLSAHNRNDPGKPAEAGVIRRVYVENFMCHRKLTVDLCRNVNFIYGQNGSGKSAILAAVQICLGAGAKRTHRARNLKELVRKEAGSNCTGAKVRVTVLNRGDDGYEHDRYGDQITVERSISLRGGYNGYKLLDENDNEVSRSKKDLDAMLDQLNIQVENPVAVLDQEEAKKFLCGKAEDKYNFFSKATELERMDRAYASLADNIIDMKEAEDRISDSLTPKKETVQALKREWEQFQELDELEEKVAEMRVQAIWAKRNEVQDKSDTAQETLAQMEAKLEKRRQDLEKAKNDANVTDDQEDALKAKVATLSKEASEAGQAKMAADEELKQAEAPCRKLNKELQHLKKKEKQAARTVKSAKKALQDTRDEIVAAAGSRESEARSRTERMETAERELAAAKEEEHQVKLLVQESQQKYDALGSKLSAAREDCQAVESQFGAVRHALGELKSTVGNDVAIFGQKVAQMAQKIEAGKRRRIFKGPVVGPIGMYVKIAQGKEQYASIAELSLGGGVLERFIVTNGEDRTTLMRFRREIGCSPRDCGIFKLNSGRRYRVPECPSPDVDLVSDVLNIENDLVFNCLVDNCKIDQVAVAESKEISERGLLVNSNGRDAIKGNVKRVFFLPNGDNWTVMRGSLQMISNERRPKQTIGIDRTAAIRDKEADVRMLKDEVDQKRKAENDLKKEALHWKKEWNAASKKMDKLVKTVTRAETAIEEIRAEADNNEDIQIDTTEQEEDVKDAEQALEDIKAEQEEKNAAIEEHMPAIEEATSRIEELATRNQKVSDELEEAENALEKYAQGHAKLQASVTKKEQKVEQMKDMVEKQKGDAAAKAQKADEWTDKARLLAFNRQQEKERSESQKRGEEFVAVEPTAELLEAIDPIRTTKTPASYQAKIEQGEKRLEKEKQKRALTESDPEVAFLKYKRAKQDLDEKMQQLEQIKKNIVCLTDDAKDRTKRWKQFRAHIEKNTGSIFNEILNKKGSSGELKFDHGNEEHSGTLNLCVQKDVADQCSQTNDVKALSGGERSFTTLSLLLALGENLETPFRVMDEFDVFLDPVSRKIALETMISIGKEMEHRQFIFITPQDLGSIKTDDKLKIFKMKNPKRGDVVGGPQQQTLPFGSPN
mmetsp:Transcript_12762/g.27023  ORF Transcript_12762/g.27023 Transcript_12762/m.27023 type:complete len:1315 (-) Transcript_12762:148-4092(-)